MTSVTNWLAEAANRPARLDLAWKRPIYLPSNQIVTLNYLDTYASHLDGVEGVYVIWVEPVIGWPQAIRVGQGVIAQRLRDHQDSDDIMHADYSDLPRHVAWASVELVYRNDIEGFLAHHYHPLRGERYPSLGRLNCNFPF